jgi:ABC-type amino acid transport substrate-binding protein
LSACWPTGVCPFQATTSPGVLRIGTYFINPPFEFVSEGEKVGFEVDLMSEVAFRLKLQPQFASTRWEVIMQEMAERRFDCIVGGITITPEPSATARLVRPVHDDNTQPYS